MLDWSIQTRGRNCAITGRSFVENEPCHTMLFELGQGYERLDLCQAAWTSEGGALAARPNLVSHWRGEYHGPPAVAPEVIGKDDAEGLLRRILELREDRFAGAAYILAVMLERKRVFKVRSTLREGSRRVWVYEHARSGEVFAIPDPDLRLDDLATVQRQVSDMLSQGIPVAQPGAASPVPPAEANGAVVADSSTSGFPVPKELLSPAAAASEAAPA